MGSFKTLVKGIGWLGALRAVTRLSTLVKTAILARLLTPADFGQFAIAGLALAFFETITETGINQVIIQSSRKTAELVDSAWVVAIVRGIAIGLVLALAAQPLASFFHNPEVVRLVYLVALVPAIKGFINPMIIEFFKSLRFSQEFAFRLILLLIDIVVSLAAAILTRSALAFVVALIVGGLAEVGLSFLWCAVKPRFVFRREYLREILGFGKWVTLAGFAHWLASELDDIVAGRWYGTARLGVYQGAYKISSLPVTEIAGTINQAAFPVMSQLKLRKAEMKKAFATSGLLAVSIGLSLSLVLFLFPKLIVAILLGPQWGQVVPLVRTLALFGLMRTVESSIQPFYLASGKPYLAAIGNVIKVAALSLGLVVWGQNGVSGIAWAAVFSVAAVMPYYAVVTTRLWKA